MNKPRRETSASHVVLTQCCPSRPKKDFQLNGMLYSIKTFALFWFVGYTTELCQ